MYLRRGILFDSKIKQLRVNTACAPKRDASNAVPDTVGPERVSWHANRGGGWARKRKSLQRLTSPMVR
jgi:hypothetical protein